MQSLILPLTLSFLSLAQAQFPSVPSGLTHVTSKVNSEVGISFKETDICERTPGVKSYSGYVHIPGSITAEIGGYDINSYFLYFEARHNASTAPLAIYLAGGPGESSTYAAMSSESGPCYININGTDTITNPWSFNNNVNMLYIDQPVQTGFSYDVLINGTYNLQEGDGLITPIEFQDSAPPTVNASLGYGTYPSQEFNHTVNNTVQAAKALWYFAEHWLSSFPGYSTQSNKLSVWGNSYGGYWVPEVAAQFSKNLQSLPSAHPLKPKNVTIDTAGITNGCVDIESSIAGYPEYAYNNTYGIRFGSEDLYEEAMNNITKPGGCLDLVEQCRDLGQVSDPDFTGSNGTVNELCMGAFYDCSLNVISAFPEINMRDPFDIALPNPPPCDFYVSVNTFLNTASVQAALGVPLNFTYDSNVVASNFGVPTPYTPMLPLSAQTGDGARQNGLPNIEYLLANNVKIAFIFGDRDFRCPWTGGEMTALAANWTHRSDFTDAGYEEMEGEVTVGRNAVVKQYGQFSFSRVLNAGHSLSAYAPETMYTIFQRTMEGKDVVTGKQEAAYNAYSTKGPRTSWGWRNTLPENVTQSCMVEGQFQSENVWAAVVGT